MEHDDKTTTNEPRMSAVRAILTRTMSTFYDVLLLVAVWMAITAIALSFNEGQAIETPLYALAMIALGWPYFDASWRRIGQTLGMRAWRLKIVDDGGGELTRSRTAARYALGIVLFGITYASIPFDPRRRALHDRLTRTRIGRTIEG